MRCSSKHEIENSSKEKSYVTIAVILIVLWLLGMVSSYTISGLIHVLLVIAIVVVLLNVIQGRSVIWELEIMEQSNN